MKSRKTNNKFGTFNLKSPLLVMHLFWQCAFSCEKGFLICCLCCVLSHVHPQLIRPLATCRKKVLRRCVKACETHIVCFQIYVCKRDIFLLFIRLFLQCAFSCASSSNGTVCRWSCIACRQKVSHRCVKACDTSCYWSDCKCSCTACTQRAFPQYVWACASWE